MTALRSRRPTPRRSDRVRDPDYLVWVKQQPCIATGVPGHLCEGAVEADHAGRRPLGRKCDDVEAIPLCTRAHRERTDFAGVFAKWTGEQMREWLAYCVELTQYRAARVRDGGGAL